MTNANGILYENIKYVYTELDGLDCHVAYCKHCGAGVVIDHRYWMDNPDVIFLIYFDTNIPCCDKPDYHWFREI